MRHRRLLFAVITTVVAASAAFGFTPADAGATAPWVVVAAPDAQTCPECGYENKPGANFCVKCGAELGKEPPEEKRVAEKECPTCGADVPPNAKFCTKCGYSLVAETEVKPRRVRRLVTGAVKVSVFPKSEATPLGISFYVGGRVLPSAALLFGLGYETWSYENGIEFTSDGYTVPFLFKFKYNFLEGRISPSLYAELGFGLSKIKENVWWLGERDDDDQGMLFGLGGGGDFLVTDNLGVFLEGGWRGRQTEKVYPWWGQTEAGVLNFFQLGGGFFF